MKFCLGLVFATLTMTSAEGQLEKFGLSVHVIDTGRGLGGADVPVKLYKSKSNDEWLLLSQGKTDIAGRLSSFSSTSEKFTKGTYKISFGIKEYYGAIGQKSMFPVADIIFTVEDTTQHYHIPLLLNAYGYSTYRGV